MFVKASGVIVLFTLVLIVVGAQQTEIANEVKDMNVNPTVNGTNTKDIGNTNYLVDRKILVRIIKQLMKIIKQLTIERCPSCPVNGNWASWGSFESCSKTCGGGQKTQTRSCTNPAPKYNGTDCQGSSSQTRSCNTKACPINGNWASWGSYEPCSESCGGGQKRRERSCTNPSPKYNGTDCQGSSVQTKSCNTKACPINGNWASWGSFESCTKSCGGGQKTQTRSCTNPAPKYNGTDCQGSSSRTSSCNTKACPINGNWESWGIYEPCSKSCGGGQKRRERSCTDPAPKYNGTDCQGSSVQTKSCNTNACPINGNWASWGSFESCSKSCGIGQKIRKRSCTNPVPRYNGTNCFGNSTEVILCNSTACPVNGAWSDWKVYENCPVSCGGSSHKKTRSCTNPAPAHGGEECPGSDEEFKTCGTIPCPVNGNWASWGSFESCSKSCGGGQKTRTRTCTDPAPKYNGTDCKGGSSQTNSCNNEQCPINGNWASWGSFEPCTKSCGGGQTTRSRSCTNPAPKYNGTDCFGNSTENVSCNTTACPSWSENRTVCVCELTSSFVQCPESHQVIKLQEYFWGRTNETKSDCKCGFNMFWTRNCQGGKIKIYSKCQDKNSCTVNANNIWMKQDPCLGIPKYAYVKYRCYG